VRGFADWRLRKEEPLDAAKGGIFSIMLYLNNLMRGRPLPESLRKKREKPRTIRKSKCLWL